MNKLNAYTTVFENCIDLTFEIKLEDILQPREVYIDNDGYEWITESVEEQIDNMTEKELLEICLKFIKERI